MVKRPHTDETESVKALKELIQGLSGRGISYAEVRSSTDESFGWSDDSLRKFVNRKNTPRITPKVRNLASAIIKLYRRRESAFQSVPNFEALIEAASSLVPPNGDTLDYAAFGSEVGQRFRHLRHSSLSALLPEKFAFVRFSRDGQFLVSILVNLKRSSNGYGFTMKISGSAKRVVVGDVSSTMSNIYFSGLAYAVAKYISEDELVNLDAFELDEIDDIVGRNVVGLESFCFSSSDISYPLIPTYFCGLDGHGNPVSGVALVVDQREFEKLGIKDTVVSMIQCKQANPPLMEAMEAAGATTNCYPEGGAFAIQKQLMSIQK